MGTVRIWEAAGQPKEQIQSAEQKSVCFTVLH